MKRDQFIDACKGIGILSIVIGHASWNVAVGPFTLPIGPFVYLYHIAFFFFCSGYLYKSEQTDYWGYVGKKLKGLYQPYLAYSLLYLLTRNLWISAGIVAGEKYSPVDAVIALADVLTFNGTGELLSAFWFLPMMFYALAIYAAVDLLAGRYFAGKAGVAVQTICCAAIGVVGVYATERQLGLLGSLQISCLLVPILALARLSKRFEIKNYLNAAGLFVSFGLLCVVMFNNRETIDMGIIELSKYRIMNGWLFYPVTCCGIYFALCLTKYLCKVKLFERILATLGRYSLAIMALHFFCFKLVDWVVCTITQNSTNLAAFPHSFEGLWPVYYLVGTAGPVALAWGGKKLLAALRGKAAAFSGE